MYRYLVLFACCASLAVAGCFNENLNKTVQQGAAQDGPSWEISYRSECGDQRIETCAGYYGFLVDASGNFTAGPGPSGQTETGKLSEDDLKLLSSAVSPILQYALHDTEPTCNPVEAQPKDKEFITVHSKYGAAKPIVQIGDKGFCASSEFGAANGFYKVIRMLVLRHYRIPFPDACKDAISELEGLYPKYQSCTTDMDCSYLTPGFEIVPPNTMQYIISDDCSRIKPLLVANVGAIVSGQDRLVEALTKAQGTCRDRLVNYECSGVSGFQATDGAPVCVQNTCQINPAVLNH